MTSKYSNNLVEIAMEQTDPAKWAAMQIIKAGRPRMAAAEAADMIESIVADAITADRQRRAHVPPGWPWLEYRVATDPQNHGGTALVCQASPGWPIMHGFVGAEDADEATPRPTEIAVAHAAAQLIANIWEMLHDLDEQEWNTTDRRMSGHVQDVWLAEADDGEFCPRCGCSERDGNECARCHHEYEE